MNAVWCHRFARGVATLIGATQIGCLEPPLPAKTRAAVADESLAPPLRARTPVAVLDDGVPEPLVVYQGALSGERGSGWASCERSDETQCDTQLASVAGEGVDGGMGLRFRARGTEWMGFGWNWFSWWPSQAGTDITEYATLALSIRVSGEPGLRPEPFTVKIGLGGSARGGQDKTRSVPIVDYAPEFADGRWHRVRVPIEALLRDEGETFDTQRAWSFTLGAWNQGVRVYEIAIDEVRFE